MPVWGSVGDRGVHVVAAMKSATTDGELGSSVLLEEVPTTHDRGVRLACRAGDALADGRVGARRDRVGVAEGAEDRAVEALELRPRRAVGGPAAGSSGEVGTSSGELPGPLLERLVGERRVVRRRSPRAESSVVQPPLMMQADRERARCPGRTAARRGTPRPGSRSPVGRTCWRRRRRRNRSGIAATRRRPMRPPQSWQTSVTSRGPACRTSAVIQSDVAADRCSRPARRACRSGRIPRGRVRRSAARPR